MPPSAVVVGWANHTCICYVQFLQHKQDILMRSLLPHCFYSLGIFKTFKTSHRVHVVWRMKSYFHFMEFSAYLSMGPWSSVSGLSHDLSTLITWWPYAWHVSSGFQTSFGIPECCTQEVLTCSNKWCFFLVKQYYVFWSSCFNKIKMKWYKYWTWTKWYI